MIALTGTIQRGVYYTTKEMTFHILMKQRYLTLWGYDKLSPPQTKERKKSKSMKLKTLDIIPSSTTLNLILSVLLREDNGILK